MLRKLLAGFAAVFIAFFAVSAWANAIHYTFHTGTNPITATGPAFGSNVFVSGTFTYDPSVPPGSTPEPDGSLMYRNGMLNLTGSIASNFFSDPYGRVFVGDDKPTPNGVDYLALNADTSAWPPTPARPHDLIGFTYNGFLLVNVRMFWREGQLAIPDFLSNQNLPASLPTFQGRLALDFVPISNQSAPLNYNNSLFFDGFYASVPEPATMLMLGLALVGLVGARKKSKG